MTTDSQSYYHAYVPSTAAAVVFTALFGVVGLFQIYQLIQSRTWFMIPLTVGCAMEAVGFAVRAVNSTQFPDYHLALYIIQTVLILVAPTLFAASIYMFFGRLILSLDAENYSMIRKRWLTKLFVFGDAISFLVQSSGVSALIKQDNKSQQNGKNIVISGLLLQIGFFGLFMTVFFLFTRRILREPTFQSLNPKINWRIHTAIIHTASILIMVRSLFRVVEYFQGDNGYLINHEAFTYGCDAGLMLACVLIFSWKHPSEISNISTGRLAVGILRHKLPVPIQAEQNFRKEPIEVPC